MGAERVYKGDSDQFLMGREGEIEEVGSGKEKVCGGEDYSKDGHLGRRKGVSRSTGV